MANRKTVVSKRTVRGVAPCPAHRDKGSMLSIACHPDGTVELRCHAGCPGVDVLAGLGLQETPHAPERVTVRRDQLEMLLKNADYRPALGHDPRYREREFGVLWVASEGEGIELTILPGGLMRKSLPTTWSTPETGAIATPGTRVRGN